MKQYFDFKGDGCFKNRKIISDADLTFFVNHWVEQVPGYNQCLLVVNIIKWTEKQKKVLQRVFTFIEEINR